MEPRFITLFTTIRPLFPFQATPTPFLAYIPYFEKIE
jgi:hypothetical protein